MGEPINRAMLLGDHGIPGPAALRRHAADAVRVFLGLWPPGGMSAWARFRQTLPSSLLLRAAEG